MQDVPFEYPDGTITPIQHIRARLIRAGRINRESLVYVNSLDDQVATDNDHDRCQQYKDRQQMDSAYQLFTPMTLDP